MALLDDFNPKDYPIVVAIELGTTFSGCAYAYAPEDKEARVITSWPKQDFRYAKTPTLNLYQEVNGEYKMVEWGWKSKLRMESPAASEYTQLSQYMPYLDENLALAPWNNKVSVPNAISDYLRALHEYVAEKILQEFGPSYSRKSFRYCLTVPAMWSDKAKDVMRKAAIRAGLISAADHPNRLTLVSEPEAAALYCEKACKQYDLGHGDQFMICDAREGTVDLIVYEIASTSQGRHLSEVTKGHGASCGYMFIDLNFGNLLIKKFESQGAMFPKSVIQTLVETFAHQLRPQFDGEEDQYLRLSEGDRFDDIRDPSSIGIEDGYMCLKASELKKVVFEPAVKQVLTLIREQLKGAKKCSAIFMVSEFGSSSYLMDRVKQDFGGRVKTISSPYKPGFAVVCGAVYAGLDQKRATARIDTDSHFTDLDFDPNDYPIVVAIDFGTTFSGCAYAYAIVDKEPRTITSWPKQDFHYAKTPTLNLYQEVDGECRMVEWGWKSKLKMKTPAASKYIQLSQYKPYLDESLILASWNNKVSVPNAISDYLNAIHEYVAEKILKDFGPSKSRKSFRYCLTVPAMWSDKAKDVMRKAAIRAGLITDADHPDRLVLVSEPEAAALYCEKACKQYDLGHGDQFMICDAGGGTVDLIVYEIASTSQGQHLSEVTKGHGASCGSIFIDLNFSNLLVKKFEGQGADIPKNVIQTLVETFAYQLKPQFDGDEELYLTIPRDNCFDDIKDPGSIGIKGGYMYLDPSELKKVVFEPVVKQVLGLIQGQLCSAKDCSAIFMVGGFGSSSYLLDRVEQEFGGRVKTISAPYKPEMAVVCGAVYVGLNPKMVTARVTRRCYGTHIYTDFEEGIDPERLKLERLDGTWCKGRFDAFVRKGQKVQVDECVTKSYGIAKYKNSQVDRSVGIYAIDGNPPRYITDVGISELAKISVPDPFKPSDPIGRRVDVEMKMYFGLNEIRTEIFIQGKKYLMELKFDGGDSY